MPRGELIAEGVYHVFQGNSDIGQETWQLSRLARGGVIVSTRIDLRQPIAESWNVSYELTSKWVPHGLSIRVERDGHRVRTDQHAEKSQWLAHVETQAGAQDFALDFSPRHEVTFLSPLFETATLVRTSLGVGDTRELDTIAIDPGSLAPQAGQLNLSCMAEERSEVPAGTFAALKYERKNSAKAAEGPLTFWAEAHGIVVRQVEGEGQEVRLVRYRWLARR